MTGYSDFDGRRGVISVDCAGLDAGHDGGGRVGI